MGQLNAGRLGLLADGPGSLWAEMLKRRMPTADLQSPVCLLTIFSFRRAQLARNDL
jgi:hypothetical protein